MKNLPTSAVREASPPKMNGFRVLILVCELHVRAPNNCSYSEHGIPCGDHAALLLCEGEK